MESENTGQANHEQSPKLISRVSRVGRNSYQILIVEKNYQINKIIQAARKIQESLQNDDSLKSKGFYVSVESSGSKPLSGIILGLIIVVLMVSIGLYFANKNDNININVIKAFPFPSTVDRIRQFIMP